MKKINFVSQCAMLVACAALSGCVYGPPPGGTPAYPGDETSATSSNATSATAASVAANGQPSNVPADPSAQGAGTAPPPPPQGAAYYPPAGYPAYPAAYPAYYPAYPAAYPVAYPAVSVGIGGGYYGRWR